MSRMAIDIKEQEKEDLYKCFNKYKADISNIALPGKFTFPFYYEPHPLAILAAEQLQDYLETQQNWEHNFGLDQSDDSLAIGKMFGVLVVQRGNELGFLCAFSGKLANSNHHEGFVPPVFDILQKGSFFLSEEKKLNKINRTLEKLEVEKSYLFYRDLMSKLSSESDRIISRSREQLKIKKADRKIRREAGLQELEGKAQEELIEKLKFESLRSRYMHKDLVKYWGQRISAANKSLKVYTDVIQGLRTERKNMSNALQQRLFSKYTFKDIQKKDKSLSEIFSHSENGRPPAGAGECAAPKLLQFAYNYDLKPIALAEFWWGRPLVGEVRIHKHYYPACRGKCEPILGHMLRGVDMDENPLLKNPAVGKELKTLYEDEHIVVINKPAEFFSVPGKTITDSVQTRMKEKYPEATGPLIVHRLDMSTSGILILAKSMDIYKSLQQQFVNRTVKKRYIALLEGDVKGNEGEINLPLRLDIEDRPRQMVCEQHGKNAATRWKVESRKGGRTRIAFYPITGRTHQLRVHAAHHLGLGCPIVGDDLYGQIGERLHLHAQFLKLIHPVTEKKMVFKCDPEF